MSLPKDKDELVYTVRVNLIYHEDRERWFSRLIRWTAFITVVLSSVAALSLSQIVIPAGNEKIAAGVAAIFGLFVTVCNGAALGFDWFGQLTAHSRLRTKWMALSLEAGLLNDSDNVRFADLLKQLASINAEEAPALPRALEKAQQKTNEALGRL